MCREMQLFHAAIHTNNVCRSYSTEMILDMITKKTRRCRRQHSVKILQTQHRRRFGLIPRKNIIITSYFASKVMHGLMWLTAYRCWLLIFRNVSQTSLFKIVEDMSQYIWTPWLKLTKFFFTTNRTYIFIGEHKCPHFHDKSCTK